MLSDYGHMLSVGAIRFEDRFCTSKKGGVGGGGWVHPGVPCTWQLPSLGATPSKNRKGGSGTSAGVEVYTAEC